MPLAQRVIYDSPVYAPDIASSSGALSTAANMKISASSKSQHLISMLECIKQIGTLSQYAAEIFDNISSLTKDISTRVDSATIRANQLASSVVDEIDTTRLIYEAEISK